MEVSGQRYSVIYHEMTSERPVKVSRRHHEADSHDSTGLK